MTEIARDRAHDQRTALGEITSALARMAAEMSAHGDTIGIKQNRRGLRLRLTLVAEGRTIAVTAWEPSRPVLDRVG